MNHATVQEYWLVLHSHNCINKIIMLDDYCRVNIPKDPWKVTMTKQQLLKHKNENMVEYVGEKSQRGHYDEAAPVET